jgi:hybrid cluster-associated redox disulfide protein
MKKQTKQVKDKINKDMTIHEIVQKYPKSAKVFMKYGMTCFGCPFAMQETLEQGALAHGIEVDKILKELNKIVKDKG